jgi:glycopeptide antibiotics resistance protein
MSQKVHNNSQHNRCRRVTQTIPFSVETAVQFNLLVIVAVEILQTVQDITVAMSQTVQDITVAMSQTVQDITVAMSQKVAQQQSAQSLP